jgi:hypothetical protein
MDPDRPAGNRAACASRLPGRERLCHAPGPADEPRGTVINDRGQADKGPGRPPRCDMTSAVNRSFRRRLPAGQWHAIAQIWQFGIPRADSLRIRRRALNRRSGRMGAKFDVTFCDQPSSWHTRDLSCRGNTRWRDMADPSLTPEDLAVVKLRGYRLPRELIAAATWRGEEIIVRCRPGT